jgi:hypothetical protein
VWSMGTALNPRLAVLEVRRVVFFAFASVSLVSVSSGNTHVNL